jgi:predicted LPLAT superfamily acyltransferase
MTLPRQDDGAPGSGDSHWAAQRERGSLMLMRLTAWAARHLGRKVVAPFVAIVVLYFYIFGARARRSIGDYQQRLSATSARPDLFPRRWPIYRQFLCFAEALLDKLDVWQGRIRHADLCIVDPDGLHAQLREPGQGRGQILVGAHLGNLEVCRALAGRHTNAMLNVLVHDKHAERFNRLLGEAGAERLRLFQVTELDAGVMLELHQRIERGEWLAIAGDRMPVQDRSTRITAVSFLGAQAWLPQGPWILAGLLHCPVNLLFCVKIGGRYRVTIERLAHEVRWKRAERDAVISQWAQHYADRLAKECMAAPLQWFNFYPFWNTYARPRNP